jgi:hypothetical protein
MGNTVVLYFKCNFFIDVQATCNFVIRESFQLYYLMGLIALVVCTLSQLPYVQGIPEN